MLSAFFGRISKPLWVHFFGKTSTLTSKSAFGLAFSSSSIRLPAELTAFGGEPEFILELMK
eukprot:CCRYP_000044-RA/>CCRYP_000044-RA protein AED:0.32 eAED:0.32 QI:91/-1/0/1/-1/1/1/0/60